LYIAAREKEEKEEEEEEEEEDSDGANVFLDGVSSRMKRRLDVHVLKREKRLKDM
jgi:hypothetical protein